MKKSELQQLRQGMERVSQIREELTAIQKNIGGKATSLDYAISDIKYSEVWYGFIVDPAGTTKRLREEREERKWKRFPRCLFAFLRKKK